VGNTHSIFIFLSSQSSLPLLPHPNLSSSSLLFPSLTILFWSYPTFISHPIFILYLSVLTYTYLYSNPNQNNLTPHVLSEWMVEVCGAYLCWVLVYVSCWWKVV
jgi:hypothetical protein